MKIIEIILVILALIVGMNFGVKLQKKATENKLKVMMLNPKIPLQDSICMDKACICCKINKEKT